jgi:phosphoserine phosphatase
MLANSPHNDVNLFVREHPASTLRKGGHQRPRYPESRYTLHRRIISDGEVKRVCECNGSSTFPIGAMATGAVVPIQDAKVHDIVGIYRDRIGRWPTW